MRFFDRNYGVLASKLTHPCPIISLVSGSYFTVYLLRVRGRGGVSGSTRDSGYCCEVSKSFSFQLPHDKSDFHKAD